MTQFLHNRTVLGALELMEDEENNAYTMLYSDASGEYAVVS